MKKFSEEAFLRDVASIDWEHALGFSSDANLLVQQLSDVFSEVIEKHTTSPNSCFRKIQSLDKL